MYIIQIQARNKQKHNTNKEAFKVLRELSCNTQTVMYILQCRIYLLQYCRKPGRDFSFRLN